MTSNIKHMPPIEFAGDERIRMALQEGSTYTPLGLCRRLARYCTYAAENAGDKNVGLLIAMISGRDEKCVRIEDELRFAVIEWNDAPGLYNNDDPNLLARFDLKLDEVIGPDWQRYVTMDAGEEAHYGLHQSIAFKLEELLAQHGICSTGEEEPPAAKEDLSLLSIRTTEWLLGTFADYRRMAYNSNELDAALGITRTEDTGTQFVIT